MWKYVSSIVGVGGPELPCTVHEETREPAWGLWEHMLGTIKPKPSDPTEEEKPVSVFRLKVKSTNDAAWDAGKNCVKRLRTLKHPDILVFKDSLELEQGEQRDGDPVLYLVTERVRPLLAKLRELDLDDKGLVDYVSWGMKRIARAISFLTSDCHLVHGQLSADAVMITDMLDWKLAAFDLLSDFSSGPPMASLTRFSGFLADARKPDELLSESALQALPVYAIDTYGLALVALEAIKRAAVQSRQEVQAGGKRVPEAFRGAYAKMTARDGRKRLDPGKLHEEATNFFQNRTVDVLDFVAELQLKDSAEKEAFFKRLPALLERVPKAIQRKKLLNQLADSLQGGTAPGHAIDGVMQCLAAIPEESFKEEGLPVALQLFQVTDRAARAGLLRNIDMFALHMGKKEVDERVYPSICGGFADQAAYVRELTLKAVTCLAGKLSQRTITSDLLKRLSRLQMDDEPAIRANTTIALGNIAHLLPSATAKRVLVNAFTRALKDPSPSARTASLSALKATVSHYDASDAASRILPSVCPLTVDSDASVREHALETITSFTSLISQYSERVKSSPSTASQSLCPQESSSPASTSSTLLSWAQRIAAASTGQSQTSQPSQQATNEQPKQPSRPIDLPSDATSPAKGGVAPGAPRSETSGSPVPSPGNLSSEPIPPEPVQDFDEADGWDEDFEPLEEDKEERARKRLTATSLSESKHSSTSAQQKTSGGKGATPKAGLKLGATKLPSTEWEDFLNS